MDEQREELAALNALRALDDDERSAFEIDVARDSELEALFIELEQTAATLAHAVPAATPPAHLKAAIMERVRASAAAKKLPPAPASRGRSGGFLSWGIAAALAFGCFALWNERTQLTRQVASMAEVESEARQQLITVRDERDAMETKNAEVMAQVARLAAEMESLKKHDAAAQVQLAQLTGELNSLRQRDASAQMQIATLQSTVAAYKQGVAVVVWDSEKQTGVLKLEKMPPVEAGKDYQLWVVDPKNPVPVNAGVVKVDAQGFAKVDFRPVDAISEAAKFALSVEKEGGVPKSQGPIILIGP